MLGRMNSSAAAAAVAAAALLVVMVPASSALATTGTATLTGGTLAMTAPTVVGFAATLNGTAQVASASQAIDVLDSTGSGLGWNITLTSTTFTTGLYLLSNTATTDTAAVGACDASVTCVLGNNAGTTYPLTVPAAPTAPTAIKIQSALAGTGLAGQTWTHSMALAVPASARAGSYASTWTYSLVSGP